MSAEYVAQLIRRAVDANTSLESPASPMQTRLLSNYFANPKYTDIAYAKVIERVETSTKNTYQILVKCLRLLKSQLSRYYPSDETLLILDRFAHRMQHQYPEAAKTLAFIRALIEAISRSRHSKRKEKEKDHKRKGKESPVVTFAPQTPSPPRNRTNDNKTCAKDSTHRGKSHRDIPPGANIRQFLRHAHDTADEPRRGNLDPNLLLQRCMRSKSFSQLSQAHVPDGATNLISPLQTIPQFALPVELTHPKSDIVSIADGDLVKERIVAVGMSKKNEERQMYRSFRRAGPLFQYKHYKEQSRLSLTPAQMKEIVNAMMSARHDTRMVASKIFIKLIMDAYCQDNINVATSVLQALLLEMLDSDLLEVKLHALNLLFNVSIHVNMFEEISFFSPPRGTTPTISRIQKDLFNVVKEVLLHLVLKKETNRRLWFSGMNLFFYFATNRGSIDKEKLVSLDYRVICGFFMYIDYISDPVWRNLVRILVNRLYLEKNTLDIHAFISGHIDINFIIDLYISSRSAEARENLFIVIFDYLLYCYIRRRRRAIARDSDSEDDDLEDEENRIIRQFNNALQLLKLIDAPHYFVNLFKYPTPTFAFSVLAAITSKSPATAAIQPIASKVDLTDQGIFYTIILPDFYKLALQYYKVDAIETKLNELQQFIRMHTNNTTYNRSKPRTPQRRPVKNTKRSESVIIHEDNDAHGNASSTEDQSGDEVSEDSVERFSPHLNLLSRLLCSTSTTEQRVAEYWLFDLKRGLLESLFNMTAAGISIEDPNHPLVQLDTAIEEIVDNVVMKSSQLSVRKIFVGVIDRLILYIRSKTSQLGEEKAMEDAAKILNAGFEKFMAAGEKSEPILMYMFDLIFSFIALPPSQAFERYRESDNTVNVKATGLKQSPSAESLASAAVPTGSVGSLSSVNSLGSAAHSKSWHDSMSALSISTTERVMSNTLDDSVAALFIRGQVQVSMKQLRLINIMALHHIFVHLPPRYTCQMRAALLYLIIERCKESKADLDAIGGNAFFKRLLTENDPQISLFVFSLMEFTFLFLIIPLNIFVSTSRSSIVLLSCAMLKNCLASRFLIDMLQKEKPDHFMDIVNTLLAKAIEADDPKLVSNPYLQVKAILEMKDTISPKQR